MAITPSVFAIETYKLYSDSMTIGLARGARDTRAPNNFQKNKSNMAAATSLKHYNGNNSFCICDRDIYLDSMTIGVAKGANGTRPLLN